MVYGLPDSIIVGTIRRGASLARDAMSPYSGRTASTSNSFNFAWAFKGVKFYPGALDYVLDNPQGDVGKYLKKRGRFIVAAAKRQVGVDTGRLQQSIYYTHLRDSRSQYLWIGSNEPHALMHHEGTRPHTIVPREAPILRFTSGSRIIYTRHVEHPGTRPNRYLSDQLYLVRI
jgi:hypothetical protein